ncbi:MAG TPA: transporter [Melioribacteraceae bacterium]|nr:transporter [Melioribacteraceae bacterium]
MSKSVIKNIIMLFLFPVLELFAQGSIPPLSTDRPDQTESAQVVPLNSIQIEIGFLFQKQSLIENNVRIENQNLILGSTLVRYGLSESVELRFGAEYFSGRSKIDEVESSIKGVQGVYFGSKFHFRKDQDLITNASLLVNFNLPHGNQMLRPERFESGIALCLEQKLNSRIDLGFNFGFTDESKINRLIYFYSASLGFNLNERIGFFIELYGDLNGNLNNYYNLDAGIKFLQKENIQIDFSAGTRLIHDKTEWFGSLGFSLRLPE